jgi:trehalose synthase
LIRHFQNRRAPFIWQCHIDLSEPHPPAWDYVRRFVAFSLPDYAQDLGIPQRFISPAINPFSIKNRELSEEQIRAWS